MIEEIIKRFYSAIECKPIDEDFENWYMCLDAIDNSEYIPLSYKPNHIEYQKLYFKDVYPDYKDISVVLYRGGKAVGIWSVCLFTKNGNIEFGTTGGPIKPPLLPFINKPEAERAIIEKCLLAIFNSLDECDNAIFFQDTVIDSGCSQWVRKLMEHGAQTADVRWQAFADLSLSNSDYISKTRRTNKYSITKCEQLYDIKVFNHNSKELDKAFDVFHKLHREVSGRETRNQKTWDMQKKIISDSRLSSFLIIIHLKDTGAIIGASLFDCTNTTGLYCVAAYDRSKFANPVGHIVQSIAINIMREMNLRWYEIGERIYKDNSDATDKLINISHFKEGFATHLFPKIILKLDKNTFNNN